MELQAAGARRGEHGLAVGFAVVAGALVLPLWCTGLLLLLLFLAGWLSPDHPVAVATAMTAMGLGGSVVRLAVTGEHWVFNDWHGRYPLEFDFPLGALFVGGDFVVEILSVWGWAVFMAYIGAGIAVRRRIRTAA